MTESQQIKAKIALMEQGVVFTMNEFNGLASQDNIRQILTRAYKAGEIKRLGRGLYYKPKISAVLGAEISPPLAETLKTLVAKQNEVIVPHGANAVRQLSLSTQTPMKYIYYTNGISRKLKLQNQTIELRHASPSKLIGANSIVGVVMSALNYLGKDKVTLSTIEQINNKLSMEEFQQVLEHIELMPGWLANIFYHYQKGSNHEDFFRAS